MWEYANDGQLYFEKAVNVFFPTLVEKWKKIGASHSVTIIMTSRTYFDNIPVRRRSAGTLPRLIIANSSAEPTTSYSESDTEGPMVIEREGLGRTLLLGEGHGVPGGQGYSFLRGIQYDGEGNSSLRPY